MAFNATCDLELVREAYAANADYEQTNSRAKCQAFITACRRLLMLSPQQGSSGGAGGETFALDLKVLENELKMAQRWLVATRPQTRHFDFRGWHC